MHMWLHFGFHRAEYIFLVNFGTHQKLGPNLLVGLSHSLGTTGLEIILHKSLSQFETVSILLAEQIFPLPSCFEKG